MKDLLEISCGLDVHKEKIVACILTGPLGKPTRSEIREFSTLIPDMIAFHLASRRTFERKFYSRKKDSGIPRSKSLP